MISIKRKQLLGLLLVFLVCLISTSPPFQSFASFPEKLRLFTGEHKSLRLSMPVNAMVTVDHPEILAVNGVKGSFSRVNLNRPLNLQTHKAGHAHMQLKLFGKIPLKTVEVNVVPDLKVIPGGQTIGVKIKSAGILVVGHHLVKSTGDVKTSPGETANVLLGDLITAIDGIYINDVSKVAEVVDRAGAEGKKLKLTIKRNGQMIETEIQPALDTEDQAYRLGLYIRDSAAGVGTLTFYAPDQGVYGALGHVITDMDTQTAIEVGDGQVVHSTVTSISKSFNGEPGEKKATLFRDGKVLGNIEKNTHFGIFGKMNEFPEHGMLNKALPVAFAEDVKEGPAEILTVVNGQDVEKYSIEIVHVAKQRYAATKGMVIRITDKRLIDKTGGIVQGMSGSPIIQQGKLVGAVTHVFVNDPTSGYGCFIEWMLQDAGVMVKPTINLEAS
ncbi:serine peptidase [Paenibacillus swuensis]|uniref:Serine peptidase n=1 Tax=Paenibacillus swuensis TaxID=1178515 RepID=A0A172TLW0_9BACL|nr:SpoIVB peptidase [Paenibacillus swuensis]ANE48059.1 serine peptidase [Paenibacillus swuensis]